MLEGSTSTSSVTDQWVEGSASACLDSARQPSLGDQGHKADGRRKEILSDNLLNCFELNNYLRQAAFMLTAILLMLLTACGNIGLLPTSELVQKAIALQLEQTQQQLSQKLDLDFQGFEIKKLSITEEKPLTIQSLPAFRVRGNYDLIIKLPKRRLTQLHQPFELYLQIQQEGKTWRLLLPERVGKNTEPIWHSYLIF